MPQKDRIPYVQYKTIDVRTLKGLEEAEKLKENGWKIGSVGFTTIQFYKIPKGNY